MHVSDAFFTLGCMRCTIWWRNMKCVRVLFCIHSLLFICSIVLIFRMDFSRFFAVANLSTESALLHSSVWNCRKLHFYCTFDGALDVCGNLFEFWVLIWVWELWSRLSSDCPVWFMIEVSKSFAITRQYQLPLKWNDLWIEECKMFHINKPTEAEKWKIEKKLKCKICNFFHCSNHHWQSRVKPHHQSSQEINYEKYLNHWIRFLHLSTESKTLPNGFFHRFHHKLFTPSRC